MVANKQALRYARRLVVIISVAVLMFVAVQVVLAFTPEDTVTVGAFKVDLVTYTLGTNESNWIYAITVLPGSWPDMKGLSHWILGFDLGCYTDVWPEESITVDTVTIDQCTDGTYNCVDAQYGIEYGYDPTTYVDGIKWNFAGGQQLEPGDNTPFTHVFEMTLGGPAQYEGQAVVGAKTGDGSYTGSILGPACQPSAVEVASLSAHSGMTSLAMFTLVVLAGFGAAGTVAIHMHKRM
jgi:hypothetical protein